MLAFIYLCWTPKRKQGGFFFTDRGALRTMRSFPTTGDPQPQAELNRARRNVSVLASRFQEARTVLRLVEI